MRMNEDKPKRFWQDKHLSPYQTLTLGFLALIVIGTMLLMLPVASASGEGLSFIDALFMATSAVCVTGLSVVDLQYGFSYFGQIVIVLLIQIGGLGLMTISTLMAILIGKKIQLRDRMAMKEALNQFSMDGLVRLTIRIIQLTLLLEFIGGTILAIRWYGEYGPIGIYYGYWHSVSAFCNAGFALFGERSDLLTLYAHDMVVVIVITLLVILGGLGFAVLSDIWQKRRFRDYMLQSKIVLVTSGILIVLGTVGFLGLEYSNMATIGAESFPHKVMSSYFHSVTARTAGIATVDFEQLRGATMFFLILLMFVGASPCSTGSGIKTTTLAVMVIAIWTLVRGRRDTVLFDRKIPEAIIYKAFAVTFMAASLVIVISMLLSIMEDFAFLAILFEVVSAFSTVGLSVGITQELGDPAKLLLAFTMFVGRVGPITMAAALAYRLKRDIIHYPEGKVTIG